MERGEKNGIKLKSDWYLNEIANPKAGPPLINETN